MASVSTEDFQDATIYRPYEEQPPVHRPSAGQRKNFEDRINSDFSKGLETRRLACIVSRLVVELRENITGDHICMLPSCIANLPSGDERGTYLALDVGGSTFRVSLVHLAGRAAGSDDAIRTSRDRRFEIGNIERALQGEAFFDWMADRIEEVFADDKTYVQSEQALLTGLSWSFPFDQWSIRDGALLQMGKGFHATQGLLGMNLADILTKACKKKNLNIYMCAMVNDSSATLLSSAYLNPHTPIALILGTGLNAAVHLPIYAFPRAKFGNRLPAWFAQSKNVVVNTEMSMFGKDIFPVTKWDDTLNACHPHPNFQPLEQLTSGRYLGEIVRLVLLDAISSFGLFDGALTAKFQPYDLSGNTITAIEADKSNNAWCARAALDTTHPRLDGCTHTYEDAQFVRNVVSLVSTRAAAYVAVSLVALVLLHADLHASHPPAASPENDSSTSANGNANSVSTTARLPSGTLHIGCCGGVVEKYPLMFERIQQNIDAIMQELGCHATRVLLVKSQESALKGAAIAVACQSTSDWDQHEADPNLVER